MLALILIIAWCALSSQDSSSRRLLDRYAEARGASSQALTEMLRNQSLQIDLAVEQCYGRRYDSTHNDFVRQVYSDYIPNDLPVYVYRFCASTADLGVHLGQYLNNLACADAVGAHFVAIWKRFHTANHDVHVVNEQSYLTGSSNQRYLHLFLSFLPQIIVHPSPAPIHTALERAEDKCSCVGNCWTHPGAPWVARVHLLQDLLHTAINGYMEATSAKRIGMKVNFYDLYSGMHKDTRPSSEKRLKGTHWLTAQRFLPLVPTITIHYRCGDNIGIGKSAMGQGLIPFWIYSKQRILKENGLKEGDVQFIYILTEAPHRSRLGKCPDCCPAVLSALFTYISDLFPAAFVVLHRGGDVFLDMARIAHSPVVFCSASTLCLWAGLANKLGTVYLPVAGHMGGGNASLDLGRNKRWFYSKVIVTYNEEEGVQGLLDKLQSVPGVDGVSVV